MRSLVANLVRILFDSRNWLVPINTRLHNHFDVNHQDVIPFSVFHNKIEHKKSHLQNNYFILNDYYKIGRSFYDEKKLQELEIKYSIPSLWKIVNQDRFLRYCSKEKVVNYLSYYFYAYEIVVSNSQVNYVVSETVTGAWNSILFFIAKYHGAEYLGYLSTRTTNKLYFNHTINDRFSEFQHSYHEIATTEPSSDDLLIIGDFLESKKNSLKPEYVKKTEKLPHIIDVFFSSKYIKEYLKKMYFSQEYQGDITIIERKNPFVADFLRAVRVKFMHFSGLFDKIQEGEKYILFPLHYQPEATTDVWADVYRDQVETINMLSHSIPFGYTLYVKEHSSFIGSRSIDFYRKLKQLPNVKLISWESNSTNLLQKSCLLATLSGTMGLEAIFYSIPVVVFGNVFYDFYEFAYKVTDPYELPGLIKKALSSNIDQRLRKNFILSYLKSGYDISLFGTMQSESSIANLTSYIIQEINKLNHFKANDVFFANT